MARHKTHKATADGKRQTQARRTTRRAKYSTTTLDVVALQAELAKGNGYAGR